MKPTIAIGPPGDPATLNISQLTDENGAAMIIGLMKYGKQTPETEQQALAGWRAMDVGARITTARAYATFCEKDPWKAGIVNETAQTAAASKFPPGHIVITPGAIARLLTHGKTGLEEFKRHTQGDWGDLDPEDIARNDNALANGERLFSAYILDPANEADTDSRIWIITERDRSVTTTLLPSEY